MSIHNETIDNSTEYLLEGGATPSRDPVPKGDYPATIINSSYDETSRDCVFDSDQMLVRPVYDYKTSTESPMTADEQAKGFSTHKSGTYLWFLLKVQMPDGTERLTSVRPNWINVLRPPNDSRQVIGELRESIGIQSASLTVGQPASAFHDRPFIARLGVKEKRGSTGRLENELVGAKSLKATGLPPGAKTPYGAEVVDVVESRPTPPISAYNDSDVIKHF